MLSQASDSGDQVWQPFWISSEQTQSTESALSLRGNLMAIVWNLALCVQTQSQFFSNCFPLSLVTVPKTKIAWIDMSSVVTVSNYCTLKSVTQNTVCMIPYRTQVRCTDSRHTSLTLSRRHPWACFFIIAQSSRAYLFVFLLQCMYKRVHGLLDKNVSNCFPLSLATAPINTHT
jgi:hypothetical protein